MPTSLLETIRTETAVAFAHRHSLSETTDITLGALLSMVGELLLRRAASAGRKDPGSPVDASPRVESVLSRHGAREGRPDRPAAVMYRYLADFDALLTRLSCLDGHREWRKADPAYDESYHTAVHTLVDFARFVSWIDTLRPALVGAPTMEAPAARPRLYIASKSKHGAQWRALRAQGYPICSTWIDENEAGQTADWDALWRRCLTEAGTADALILYAEEGESLVGAFVEAGAALSAGRPVLYVGPTDVARNLLRHPLVERFSSMDAALSAALTRPGAPQ